MLRCSIAILTLLTALAATASESPEQTQPPVTYASHAAEILNRRCVSCHRPGGIGPFSLTTHRDAESRAAMIREVVTERRMPPWHADGRYGRFKNDRRFTEQEYYTLLAWLDAGTPSGDLRGAPKPELPPADWRIGQPDVIFSIPETANIPATGVLPYQYYETPLNFPRDQWVQAIEARPGNERVVHHILVYLRQPNSDPAERRVLGLGSGLLKGYAPGGEPLILEPGVALRIPAQSTLLWQLHYTPTGKPETDRSQLGLKFATEPPRFEHKTGTALNRNFVIPAHNGNYTVRSEFTFPASAWLTSLTPHMHLRGKSFYYEAVYPNGGRQVLLNVPSYDFNWQTTYILDQPIPVPAGTRIRCVATFDNSAANPYNPNPAIPVRWGDQTWDEMMIGWFTFVWDAGNR